jgi:galactokinase
VSAAAILQTDKVDAISNRIASEYEQRTKINPTLFVSRPAEGATVLKS